MHWAAQSDLVMSQPVDTRPLHCQLEGRQLAGWCEDSELEVGSQGSGVRMETDYWEVACQNYSVTVC